MSETHPEPIDPETAPAAAPSAPRPLSLRGRAFKALALSPEPPLPAGLGSSRPASFFVDSSSSFNLLILAFFGLALGCF